MSGPGLHDNPSTKAIPHRLPTVSASAALRKASASSNSIQTGSKQIDSLLVGGLTRGKVAEVHGPPGSGKTSFALSAAAHVLQDGAAVVWMDCGYRFSFARLEEAIHRRQLSNSAKDNGEASVQPYQPDRFHHYETSALAYLLALLLHPPAGFLPAGTRLLVVESVSTLFASAFPNNYTPSSNAGAKETPQQWAASRRWSLQRDIMSTLNKLAAIHDMAVLVTCQMATRFDREYVGPGKPKAMLRPSLNTKSWTDGLWARILLFRHWGPRQAQQGAATARSDSASKKSINRYAGLVKLGSTEYEICGRFVPFVIAESCITDVQQVHVQANPSILDHSGSAPAVQGQPVLPAKRHLAQIADSESEGEPDDITGALDGDDVEELNEMGLTREEQALLDLELENTKHEG